MSATYPVPVYRLSMVWNRWCDIHQVEFVRASHSSRWHVGATVYRCPHCVEEARRRIEAMRDIPAKPPPSRQVVTPAVMMPD